MSSSIRHAMTYPNIRYIQTLGALALVLLLGSCAQPLTKKLFFTSARPHAYLPTDKEEQAGRAGTLSEIVTYTQRADTIKSAKKQEEAKLKNDGMKTIAMEEVVVRGERPKVRISTLRKGKINLTFLVTVPKNYLDSHYQVVLSPELTTGDTTLFLPPVVLKGQEFKKVQDQQQKRMTKFEESIVETSKYDSAFFNNKRHRRFMNGLQNVYYRAYKRQLSLQLDYERWLRITEQRYWEHNAKHTGLYDSRYHEKALQMLRHAYREELQGRDSVGQREGFDMLYTPERRAAYLAKHELKIDSTNIPHKFKELFFRGWTMDSLRNHSLSEKDSLEAAKHTYDFKAIARNESRREHLKGYERHIVHFPVIADAQHEADITPGQDFAYLYSRDIEVTPQMKKRMKLIVDARVTATDRSTWMQRGIDTLSFIISGINDLVDDRLIDRLNEKPEAAAEYKLGLERLAARDYRGALEYLRKYPDYNGALALAGMDEDERAIAVLNQLHTNGKVEYLKAYCYTRLKRYDEARKALLAAVKLQSFLVYKAETESVFAPLFEDKTFLKNLKNQAEELDEE